MWPRVEEKLTERTDTVYYCCHNAFIHVTQLCYSP